MTHDSSRPTEDDPGAWSAARLADEVAYAACEVGRPHCGAREIAFALEIKRLNVLLAFAQKYSA